MNEQGRHNESCASKQSMLYFLTPLNLTVLVCLVCLFIDFHAIHCRYFDAHVKAMCGNMHGEADAVNKMQRHMCQSRVDARLRLLRVGAAVDWMGK